MAIATLELLEKHSRIDPRRVGLMGFSRGGQAAPCVELGPTVAYDEKGHAAAQKAVKEFFAATLLAP